MSEKIRKILTFIFTSFVPASAAAQAAVEEELEEKNANAC